MFKKESVINMFLTLLIDLFKYSSYNKDTNRY